MTADPLDLILFGELRPPAETKLLRCGALNAVRDALGLRWVRHGTAEMLRGVVFVVRDENWSTMVMEDVHVTSGATASTVQETITARAQLPGGHLDCKVEVTMSDSEILLIGTATAHGRLQTNRTGFVVLYPESCAGHPVTIEHGEDGIERQAFPRLISPHQPFMDIRALTYGPAPGLTVRCTTEGEVFEMEDQRNWSDASFKVYSRPLARPFPYAIEDGETVRQAVRIAVTGSARSFAEPRTSDAEAPVHIEVGTGSAGWLPRLGIGGTVEDWDLSAPEAALLSALRPAVQMAEADLAKGVPDLAHLAATAERIGGSAALMARLPPDGALEALEALAQSGPKLSVLALAGATAGSLAAARRLFPTATIGVGTDAFFAEFNRKPPPVGADFVIWTVNPTVHAIDDESVMETLRALPAQAETARAMAPGVPLWCGPLTMRKRFNPNATHAEPSGPRETDPRQRGLFGAAFTLGQIAAWSAAGLDTLLLYQPCGPGGLIERGSGAHQAVLPPFHVLAGLASGDVLRALRNDSPRRLAALATAEAVWFANLTPHPLDVHVTGVDGGGLRLLDERNFSDAALASADWWKGEPKTMLTGPLILGAYGLARIGRWLGSS